MDICHNCGLPSDCSAAEGHTVRLEIKPSNKFHRTSHRTVWCHSEECAVQAPAIARYGLSTHKWPVRFAQARATHPLEGLDRTETIAGTRINTASKNGSFENLDLEAGNGFPYADRVLKRKGGRPRKWRSEADRVREYRRRGEVFGVGTKFGKKARRAFGG